MQMLKREFYLFFAATAFVVLCALSWGKPFLANVSNHSAAHARVGATRTSSVFAGTILRDGRRLVFRTATGQTFRLDQPQQALPFAGESVTITGSLDMQTGMVHVKAIHPAA
jgi:hypothetical protein